MLAILGLVWEGIEKLVVVLERWPWLVIGFGWKVGLFLLLEPVEHGSLVADASGLESVLALDPLRPFVCNLDVVVVAAVGVAPLDRVWSSRPLHRRSFRMKAVVIRLLVLD